MRRCPFKAQLRACHVNKVLWCFEGDRSDPILDLLITKHRVDPKSRSLAKASCSQKFEFELRHNLSTWELAAQYQIWNKLYSISQPQTIHWWILYHFVPLLRPDSIKIPQNEVCVLEVQFMRMHTDTSFLATVRSVFITKYMPWETTEVGRRSSSTKRLAMAPLASSPGSVLPVTEERSSLSQR